MPLWGGRGPQVFDVGKENHNTYRTKMSLYKFSKMRIYQNILPGFLLIFL